MINFLTDGRVHAYLKGILQSINSLKNKCTKQEIIYPYPFVNDVLGNNIAHATNVCFISQYALDKPLSNVGEFCGPASRLDHLFFASSSNKQQEISRETLKDHQTNSREIPNKWQRNGNG